MKGNIKRNTLLLVTFIFAVILIGGCASSMNKENYFNNDFVTAKLVNISGGNLSRAAGLYEGKLTLVDVNMGEEYSIFTCIDSWDWVKLNSCYFFNNSLVKANIENHKYSMELSGCYVGTLNEVNC